MGKLEGGDGPRWGGGGETVKVGPGRFLLARQLIVGTRAQARELMLQEVETLPAGADVRVDLSKTTYVDSSGLGVLVKVARAVRARGGALHLDGCSPDILTLLELTKLMPEFGSVGQATEQRG